MYLKPIFAKDIISIQKTSTGWSVAKTHPHMSGEIVRVGKLRGERLLFNKALHDARLLEKQEKALELLRGSVPTEVLLTNSAALRKQKEKFAEKYAEHAPEIRSVLENRPFRFISTFAVGAALYVVATAPVFFGLPQLLREVFLYAGPGIFTLSIPYAINIGSGDQKVKDALNSTGIGASSSEKTNASSG